MPHNRQQLPYSHRTLEDAAENNTLNLVQQRRPRKKAGRPTPKQEKEQQQDEWEEQEEEETPKGTGKQQRKKGRKLKYTQAPHSFSSHTGLDAAHPSHTPPGTDKGQGREQESVAVVYSDYHGWSKGEGGA